MDTQAIASRLVQISRTGDFRTAQDELYASNARSVEPEGSMWPTVEGIEALNAKVAQWEGMIEQVHSIQVSEPLVMGDYFTCTMEFVISTKELGRIQGREVCVYGVEDGKIVLEHFFYNP